MVTCCLPGIQMTESSDLQRYARILLIERRKVVFASVIVGATLFAAWAGRQPKIYEATVSLVVDAAPPQILGDQFHDIQPMGLAPGAFYSMEEYIQTQLRVVTSDSMARRAVERLRLLDDKLFWDGAPPQSIDEAAQGFIGSVSAAPVADTQIVVVSFRHTRPDQAKRAVDGLVDAYIEANIEKRDISNAKASQWLTSEADTLRKQVSDSELALYEFKRKNELLAVALEDRINNVSRQIDKLSDALTDARLKKIARASEAGQLGKMLDAEPATLQQLTTGGGDVLATLDADLVQEQRRLSELQARYADAHPLVRQEVAKMRSIEGNLRREVAAQLQAAQAKEEEAAAEEKKIVAQLEVAKQDGLRITRLEVEYNKLKRENDAITKQYSMVQNRTKETELASQVKANNLHVLDYARMPTMPVSPHLMRAGTAAMFFSILLGVLFALLLDALDRSIKTQEDVEVRLKWPLLGVIPRIDGARRDVFVAESPSSVVAECFRSIRSKLQFSDLTRPVRRLLVTSALPREGKTLVTLNLAIVMAQAGKRVLVIDGDLRRPSVSAALGVRGSDGLTDVLLASVSLDKAIRPTRVQNLSVLPAGTIPPNPSELIETPRFREILEQCAAGYDTVLIDSPPAVPVNDPAVLAGYCDGVVLVVRSHQTSRDQADRARRKLIDTGARIIGVALNDCETGQLGYGSYEYAYGQPPEREAAAGRGRS
ncbi:MAG: polysaccharide biosynthesis tyrosine autokinase [Myxococcales bacterium]|nr:polysaccharide biosynthesis tyrosine autokinase [Myxococcales bacterium]